jgi:ribosomal-protein-alanine N-acetyltransferase
MRARDIEIVPMRVEDLDDVLEIERHGHPSPWSRQVFSEELEREWARIDVLRERDPSGTSRVVAFCNYWIVRDEIHVLNVATHPERRRRGHAARLLEQLLDVARSLDSRYLTLEVRKSNRGAIALYERFGFRSAGVRRRYYQDNGEDAIVMWRTPATLRGTLEDVPGT